MLNLSGISIPITTPFLEEKIGFKQVENNIRIWKQYALRGFVLLGSTGEGAMLSLIEKEEFVDKVTEMIPESFVKILGASFQSTKETIEFLKFGEKHHVNAGLVLPPYYYRSQMTPDTLKRFYSQIAEESGLPIIIYHFPGVTGITFNADFVLDLAQNKKIIGIKDSSANLSFQQALIKESPKHFQVLTGSANTLVPSLFAGAAGGIVALANVAPEYCTEIYKLFLENNMDEMREIQYKILHINSLVTGKFGIPGIKFAMDKLGLYGGLARLPFLPLETKAKQQIIDELINIELIRT
ncbi:MAG: dihydrodipicolinate synthase family protein [Candidatus Hodarchaeales archaeon]|jgi:4-hydroxy-2-oxoglutarate aldolase